MAVKSEDVTNVMAFDALYTTNQIQKLKVLLPYIEPSAQKHLAVYIKYMELQYTLDYVKKHPFQIYGCSIPNQEKPKKPDLKELCRQLSHYSTPDEIRQLEQMQHILQAMEQFQEMSQMMSVMQEIFPDMGNAFGADESSESDTGESASSPGFSMMDMLMNMLTPEQREMYEMFQKETESGI